MYIQYAHWKKYSFSDTSIKFTTLLLKITTHIWEYDIPDQSTFMNYSPCCFCVVWVPYFTFGFSLWQRYEDMSIYPQADVVKLYYHFLRLEGSGLAGIFIVAFLYVFTMFMSASILYMYFLRYL